MARGDFWPKRPCDGKPSIEYREVYAGTATSIKAGEPVIVDGSHGGYVKAPGANVTTGDTIVGFAMSDSTDTASANGFVYVACPEVSSPWIGRAKTKANLAVAKKDTNVVIDFTTPNYTVDESTTTNGLCHIVDYNSTTGEIEFTVKMSELPNA